MSQGIFYGLSRMLRLSVLRAEVELLYSLLFVLFDLSSREGRTELLYTRCNAYIPTFSELKLSVELRCTCYCLSDPMSPCRDQGMRYSAQSYCPNTFPYCRGLGLSCSTRNHLSYPIFLYRGQVSRCSACCHFSGRISTDRG